MEQNNEIVDLNTPMKFIVECTMNAEQAVVFISMLKEMQLLGKVGASRTVGLKIDGDGNFKPEFNFIDLQEFMENWPTIKPDMKILKEHNQYIYDADKCYDIGNSSTTFIENSCKCDVFPGEGIIRS
jgi:hypothetical protein